MVVVNAERRFVRLGHVFDERLVVRHRWRRRSSRPAGRLRQRVVVEREALVQSTTPRSCHAPQLAHDQAHRHRVQHLVADHHAFEMLRQRVQPAHLRGQRRARRLRSSRAGARAIRPTNPRSSNCRMRRPARRARSASRRRACPCRRRIPSGRACRCLRRPAARGRASVAANSGDISGAVTKSLPSSDRAAEFQRAAAVIAESRRIKGQFHVAVERQPAAGRCDLRADLRASASDCAARSGPGAGKLSGWSSFRIHPGIVNERFFDTSSARAPKAARRADYRRRAPHRPRASRSALPRVAGTSRCITARRGRKLTKSSRKSSLWAAGRWLCTRNWATKPRSSGSCRRVSPRWAVRIASSTMRRASKKTRRGISATTCC